MVALSQIVVWPCLQYCAQLWSLTLYLRKDIADLGKVQKRATKKIKGLERLSSEERLRSLGLLRLGTKYNYRRT